MLNEKKERELAYVVIIDTTEPIVGSDNCEAAVVGGWRIMVRKGVFQGGDAAIYFEIDSKVDTSKPEFAFMERYHGKVKTQKYTFGGKGNFISQGLLMHPSDFGWEVTTEAYYGEVVIDSNNKAHYSDNESRFLTKQLGVTYATVEDNKRKNGKPEESTFRVVKAKYPKFFANSFVKKLVKYQWFRKFIMTTLGKKAKKLVSKKSFPVGIFPGVSITDQERAENMTWVLEDKTPFIVTQKCDGSSSTYILERKPHGKYEFYVCSRKVRMLNPEQENYFSGSMESNLWWDLAIKYDIENKLRDFLEKHPEEQFVCWQGEGCYTNQGNPHKLKEPHLFLFHMMTTSSNGKWDIREAKKVWDKYGMESVPIVCDNYILPNDFEEFKASADGDYAPEVCEGQTGIMREGFVYYKTTDPNFSFKNVSRKYLLKHGQ